MARPQMRGPGGRRGMRGGKRSKNPKKTLGRLMKYIQRGYGVQFVVVLICILLSAVANVAGSMFLKSLIDDYISPLLLQASPVFTGLLHALMSMAVIYLIGIATTFVYNWLMVSISQGVLKKVRDEMFAHMQKLPIRYFDTHTHGDLMSHFTNDTDTLQQMLSQSVPQMFSSAMTIISVFIGMLVTNVWLTLFVLLGVCVMLKVVKKLGGQSAKYFLEQQKSLGRVNGYIEEMMAGQKVVKVFNHEEDATTPWSTTRSIPAKSSSSAMKAPRLRYARDADDHRGHLLRRADQWFCGADHRRPVLRCYPRRRHRPCQPRGCCRRPHRIPGGRRPDLLQRGEPYHQHDGYPRRALHGGRGYGRAGQAR